MMKTYISMMKTYIPALIVVLLLIMGQTAYAQKSVSVETESEMLALMFKKGLAEYKAGNYDESIRLFDAMLAIDEYNNDAVEYRARSAKRMAVLERINKDAGREQAMAEIKVGWTESRHYGAVAKAEDGGLGNPEEQKAVEQMIARLKSITLPSLEFTDARIEDVAYILSEAGRRVGDTGQDVDFAILGMEYAPEEIPVSLSTADMNLYEALRFLADMTSLKFEVGPNVVSIMPANYLPISQIVTKSYDINPEVGDDLQSVAGSDGGLTELFSDSSSGEADTGPVDVVDFFPVVSWPHGSSAIYQPRFNKLFVKNTSKALRAVEEVLADLDAKAANNRSQQVEIEAKFVEFNEGALEELGFDWNVYGSGTAAGMELDRRGVAEGAPPNARRIDPITGQAIYAGDDSRPGQNVFGSALRNNTQGFELIETGVLSLMGGSPATMLFNNDNIDIQISAMEQEGTADVLSAPKVTTKSGAEALIRVAETHRYPQDYDTVTGQNTIPVLRPQDWADFDLGVSLKVTPVIDMESGTIDLTLKPEILKASLADEYLIGFNRYTVRVSSNTVRGPVGDGRPLIATMPSFNRRFIETNVNVADGHTVVLGGLLDERTETFRDQVPILGDIPYLGRLFRSEGSRSAKRNLTIFVKASIVDDRGMSLVDYDRGSQTTVN